MTKVEIKFQNIDAGVVSEFGKKSLRVLGWFFLLYIIAVVCVHIASFPFLMYRFYSGNWGKSLDTFLESSIMLFSTALLYLLLNISGLLIFIFRKKKLNQTYKIVKVRKVPLVLAVFFSLPFSYHFFSFVLNILQPLNPFYHLESFLMEHWESVLFLPTPPTNLMDLYRRVMGLYFGDRLAIGYMITIFCTYYVIKQIYLYVYHASKKSLA